MMNRLTLKISLCVIIVATFCSYNLFAQNGSDIPIRQIKAKSEDPNNDEVPNTFTLETSFEKVIIVRLKHKTDLLEGLFDAVLEHKIKDAVILSGIGSLTSYKLHAVSNTTFPSENVTYESSKATDLVAVNGYIFNGKPHVHVTVSDDKIALGGHLELGTEIFTFAILTIGILEEGTDISRFDDKTWR